MVDGFRGWWYILARFNGGEMWGTDPIRGAETGR
jgi:hypothetical protein